MGVFLNRPQATRLAFDDNSFSVYLADGRIFNVPLAYFSRLLHADQRQRENYELSGVGTDIHWDGVLSPLGNDHVQLRDHPCDARADRRCDDLRRCDREVTNNTAAMDCPSSRRDLARNVRTRG
jgi:hypothetical protein